MPVNGPSKDTLTNVERALLERDVADVAWEAHLLAKAIVKSQRHAMECAEDARMNMGLDDDEPVDAGCLQNAVAMQCDAAYSHEGIAQRLDRLLTMSRWLTRARAALDR